MIRYPPTKPTLIEEPQAGSSSQAEKSSGQQIPVVTLTPSAAEKFEDPQGKSLPVALNYALPSKETVR